MGGHIFTLIYSKALHSLRLRLRAQGIVLKMKKDDDLPFWSSNSKTVEAPDSGDEIIEATFVDDECLMICGTSPQKLDVAAKFMLSQLMFVFSKFGFVINWSKGKTEIICKYRGKHAAEHMREKCCEDSFVFPLPPNASASHVSIVKTYKYLGSYVSSNCSLFDDAVHRVSLALNAYAPIAARVFGSKSASLRVKLLFFASLVCSRLFCNTELYVFGGSSSIATLRKLNTAYMRVLRRIAGEMRFGQCVKDIEVRESLNVCSIDCHLRKLRLRYLSRMISRGPSALITADQQKRMPSVQTRRR